MKRERRKIKLINPSLQLRIVGAFAGVSILSFVLQGLFVASRLTTQQAAAAAGHSTPSIWVEIAVLSLGLFLPLTIALGILLTHRIAGPAYRMEQHLRGLLRGEEMGDCRLRDGDELGELCNLLNQTVTFLREGEGSSEDSPESRRDQFRAVS